MQKRSLVLIPAALILAGATGFGFVHASNQTQTSTPPASVAPNTDGDNVQAGDQNAPDVASAQDKADVAAEKTAPETDKVQSGDQSGPDTGTADAADTAK